MVIEARAETEPYLGSCATAPRYSRVVPRQADVAKDPSYNLIEVWYPSWKIEERGKMPRVERTESRVNVDYSLLVWFLERPTVRPAIVLSQTNEP